jgi:hypothetical protein
VGRQPRCSKQCAERWWAASYVQQAMSSKQWAARWWADERETKTKDRKKIGRDKTWKYSTTVTSAKVKYIFQTRGKRTPVWNRNVPLQTDLLCS